MHPRDMIRATMVFATVASAAAAQSVETPGFEVLQSGDGVELRRYAPMIVAEVTVEADTPDAASSRGFTPLANYIFGKNRPGEKISMTAPVKTVPSGEGGALRGGDGEKIAMTAPVKTAPSGEGGAYTVQFVMPAKWNMETLPAPEDDSVRLREVAARHVIAAGYTGPRSRDRMDELEDKLRDFAQAQGLTPSGPFEINGYSGPSVPREKRYWEVQQSVEAPAS